MSFTFNDVRYRPNAYISHICQAHMTSGLLKAAYERGGDWKAACRELKFDMAFYVTRQRAFVEVLPWDFIDIGVRKEYLKSEHTRAREGRYTPPCVVGTCMTCGVCT